MKKSRLVQIKIGIPPSLKEKLVKKSESESRTFSDTSRYILEEYVKKHEKEFDKIIEKSLLV